MKMMMNALATTTAVAASFLAYTAQAQNNGNGAQCLDNHHFNDGTVLINQPGSYK